MSRCKRKCIKYQSQEQPQDSFCKMRKVYVRATALGTYVILCDFLIILEISIILSKFVVLSSAVGLAVLILVRKLDCFRAIILKKFSVCNSKLILYRVILDTADTCVACNFYVGLTMHH